MMSGLASAMHLSDSEKSECIKLLKVYFEKYSDATLSDVLSKTKWDTDKALELMME